MKDQDLTAQAPAEFAPGPLNPIGVPIVIDWGRPVRTKGGHHPIRILAIDYSLRQPIVGVQTDIEPGQASVWSWFVDGAFQLDHRQTSLDLENSPEAPKEVDHA